MTKFKLKRGWMWARGGRYCTAKGCWGTSIAGSKVTLEGRCGKHLAAMLVIPSHEHYARLLSGQLREPEAQLVSGERKAALARLRSLRRILAP